MGEQLVYLRDSVSLLDVPPAVELLRRRGMQPVKDVPPDSRGDVVAVIAGLKSFGVADAEPFPALRTVARFGAGYDNIDVNGLWATRRISVSYTPDVSSGEVAEMALAMMILTLRGVPRDLAGLAAEPSRWRVIGRGVSLSDATVGVIGCGNIGLTAARLVAPLAARVLLWNRPQRTLVLPGLPEDHCQPVEDLDTVAERSDVVTVHLPLTPETRGLVGTAFFDKVKAAGRSIALVNTARGGVVDEEALLAALQSGVVRAAAIDVWSSEGPASTVDFDSTQAASATPADNARLRTIGLLRHHPAVLPTSHIGAFTTGVLHRCGMQCAQNIVSVVAGERGSPGFIATPAQ